MDDKKIDEFANIRHTHGKKEEEEKRGFAAPALDPVGNVLGKGLRPVGTVVETITKPVTGVVGSITKPALAPALGEKPEKMEILGGENKDSYNKPEKIAGKEQTGDNPLGLDQTGRWGFRDEE